MYVYVYMCIHTHTLHLYPFICQGIGCFHVLIPCLGCIGCSRVLAIVNSAAMNFGVHVSFQIKVFSGYMPRSGIAGSYGSPIFSFLRNLYVVLCSGHINLHSHRHCRTVLFPPHPFQHLLPVDFLMMTILAGMR